MKNLTDELTAIMVTNELGWRVHFCNSVFEFSNHSPAGQEISVCIEADSLTSLASQLRDYYESYDCSEETMLWLDPITGHGKNGAPYEMIDVYKDMEAVQQMLGVLADAIQDVALGSIKNYGFVKTLTFPETIAEAREQAMEWQRVQSQQSMSYGEISEATEYFSEIAKHFGVEIEEEFRENGII